MFPSLVKAVGDHVALQIKVKAAEKIFAETVQMVEAQLETDKDNFVLVASPIVATLDSIEKARTASLEQWANHRRELEEKFNISSLRNQVIALQRDLYAAESRIGSELIALGINPEDI